MLHLLGFFFSFVPFQDQTLLVFFFFLFLFFWGGDRFKQYCFIGEKQTCNML